MLFIGLKEFKFLFFPKVKLAAYNAKIGRVGKLEADYQ